MKETGLNIIGKDSDFQRPGNRIELQEVIDMYQDTTKYAAILVSSCYKGPITNFKSSIKGFMPFGFSGITNYPLQAIFEVVHGRNETLVFGGS